MFDVIIVGGGPAGLSAALMLGRCRRRVLVCDLREPRNRRSRALHGYLTRDGIPPLEFNELGRREIAQYGIRTCIGAVTAASRTADGFSVRLADGHAEQCRYLLIATGVADELPDVPGVDACYGRSLFHCPYCDAWEWRDRRLAVLGEGASGARLALSIKTWSPDVVLCSNGSSIPRREQRRLEQNGIATRRARIDRLEHTDGLLSRVVFEDEHSLERDALFCSTRQRPQTALALELGCGVTRHGTVKSGILSDTNIPGVFVAGDVSRDAQFVVVAAAEGVKAAMAINQHLQRRELQP